MMIRATLILLAIALVNLPAVAAASGLSVQRWVAANTQAIARIHDRKKHIAAQQEFLRTRDRLAREEGRRLSLTPPHDPQRLARSILSNARLYKFLQPGPAPQRTWWQRILDWLGARWSQVMRAIFGGAAIPARVNRGVADALLGLSIFVFLALLARVAWLYARPARSQARAVPLALPDDPAQLLALSINAAQRGGYALAIAQLFAAAIALLTIKRRFEGRASETVGEMGGRIASSDPRLREPFDELTQNLTRAIYAEHPLAQDDWARSLGAYHRLEALVQT